MEPIVPRLVGGVRNILGMHEQQPTVIPLTHDADQILNEILSKSSKNIVPSFYDTEDVPISNPERPGRTDVTDTESIRRAIHTISNYYNTLGTYRDDFDKVLNDKLARNTYYVLCEKAIQDYMGSAKVKIVDKDGGPVESAMDFLDAPNPQDDFGSLMKMAVRDMVRYDAGVWVKSFNAGGYLVEMKSYLGTEFWKEQDRVSMIVNMPFSSAVNFDKKSSAYATHWEPAYTGWWSHGYIQRYWQRSRTGVYIPFQPEEICYFMMYPRSDGIYGTDFLKYLRYQLQYLIDSTKAAGKTFENGLVPSVVWMHDNVKNIQQLEQRIKEVRMSNQGPNRFGSILHTVSGEKVESLAQSLHNMEWLEGQKFIAQVIWAMWGFSPEEFIGGDSNRATSYVKRNITKSRLLYPLMDHIEKKMNREVLPYLKGYRKGWKFLFLRDVDLDDDQKLAQTTSTRLGSVAQGIGMGFTASQAMKLAGMGDELKMMDSQSLDDQISQFNIQQGGGGQGNEMPEDAEMGRYDGEGAGSAGYVGVNLSDYGQGGEDTETRTGETDEKEYRKGKAGDFIKIKDHAGVIRKAEITTVTESVIKSKVYISSPTEAPKGRTVRRGSRGQYYYMTSERKDAKSKPSGPRGTGDAVHNEKKQRRSGSSWSTGSSQNTENQDKTKPNLEGADRWLEVSGDNISFYLMEKDGKFTATRENNSESRGFVDNVSGCFKQGEDMMDCIKKKSKQMGLVVKIG